MVTVHRGLTVKLGIGIGESHAINFRHDHHEDEINGSTQQLISEDIITSGLSIAGGNFRSAGRPASLFSCENVWTSLKRKVIEQQKRPGSAWKPEKIADSGVSPSASQTPTNSWSQALNSQINSLSRYQIPGHCWLLPVSSLPEEKLAIAPVTGSVYELLLPYKTTPKRLRHGMGISKNWGSKISLT